MPQARPHGGATSSAVQNASPDGGIGGRIADYRHLAGYTQQGLADAALISVGAIRKVERGERMPTYGLLNAVARVLLVTVQDLTGQPYRGERRADEDVHAPITAIRAISRSYDLPPEWRTGTRPLDEIAADLTKAERYRAAARYTRLGELMPGLLDELTAAVYQHEGAAADRKRAARMLVSAYYLAGYLAYKLGYADLSGQLDDRLRWAADLAEDPLSQALAKWSRATDFQQAKDYQPGLRILEQAREELQASSAAGTPNALVVMGSLHLHAVTLSARLNHEQGSTHHLEQAALLAGQIPDGIDRVAYHLTFGPGNVAVHDVGAHVELRHTETAADKARKVRLPDTMPGTRRSMYQIEAARAFLAAGSRDEALKAIQEARRIAPQQTRYLPMAREAVRLLGRHYARANRDVRGLALWMESASRSS